MGLAVAVGVGVPVGVIVGVVVAVAVGVGVGDGGNVAVGVGVGVNVGVGVGVNGGSLGVGTAWQKISIELSGVPSLPYPPASQMWPVPKEIPPPSVSVGKLRRAVTNGTPVSHVSQ